MPHLTAKQLRHECSNPGTQRATGASFALHRRSRFTAQPPLQFIEIAHLHRQHIHLHHDVATPTTRGDCEIGRVREFARGARIREVAVAAERREPVTGSTGHVVRAIDQVVADDHIPFVAREQLIEPPSQRPQLCAHMQARREAIAQQFVERLFAQHRT